MPHVAFVPFSGLRVRDRDMLDLGMSLPGLNRRANSLAHLPALGLLTLAGMLPESWTCSYHSAVAWDEELVRRIRDEAPALVAVSALTASVQEAYDFCARMRQERIPVVLGGLHATALPEEAALHADAVVVGSGEPVWREVLSDVRSKCLRRFYVSPRSTPLREWPLPRFELVGRHAPRYTLQTQRGCPFACDFCGASRLLSRHQEKPIERIKTELAAIRKLDPRAHLELADDNTFAGSRNGGELLDALEQSGASWFTEADWRIGERPDVLHSLARAGCREVLLGIESLCFRYPGMGEKQADLQRVMSSVQAIQEAGVAVNGCFIVGAEGETQASLDRLTQFVIDSPLAEVQITLQTPFPGTALYRRLAEQGRLLPQRGWSHYTLFDVTYQPDILSVADLELAFRRLLRDVFSASETSRRASICRRIWRGAKG